MEIPHGQVVKVLEEGRDWCRISWQDKIGFCQRSALELEMTGE